MGKQINNHLEIFMKCRLNLDGTWNEVSSRLCDLLGHTEQKMRKMTIEDVVRPEDKIECSATIDKLRSGESSDFETDVKFLTAKGDSITVFISGMLIRNRDGKPAHIACHIQNLSKQNEVLQKLAEREQQFNSLFRHNPHPVYYFDLEGNFEGVNDKLVEFTGVSREELLKKGFEEFIVEEDLERTKRQFQKAAKGNSGQYEIKVKVKGGIKDIRVTKFPRYFKDEVVGVYGILQDFTEEKKAKQKLERSEQLFKSLFTHNPYPVMRFSLEGKFQDANKKTVELSGFSRKELLNFDFSSFIADEDYKRIAGHFQKAANGETQHYDVKANTKNGEIEVQATLSPVYVDGEITALFCIAKDITEEKRTKLALKRSEERWQQLVEQNPQPVQIVQDGKIVYINKAGAEYYGADSVPELIGKPILDFAHPDYKDKILERKNSLEKNQSVDPYEHKILLLNGEERYIEAHSIPIVYRGKHAIQTVVHDITNLKEKQQIIGKSLKEKETLLKEIHHRVKNNLAVISSMLELQIMQSANESAINALRDSQLRIRSIAMIHEKLYQNESLYDIRFDSYLQELVETILHTYVSKEKNIETTFTVDPVSLDIEQIIPCSLIVNEVVVNCFKHAFTNKKEGGIQISLDDKDSSINLTITDDGDGLPDNFNIDEQQSLGMTLIQALTSQLEGTFNFANGNNGDGTTFRLRFKNKT